MASPALGGMRRSTFGGVLNVVPVAAVGQAFGASGSIQSETQLPNDDAVLTVTPIEPAAMVPERGDTIEVQGNTTTPELVVQPIEPMASTQSIQDVAVVPQVAEAPIVEPVAPLVQTPEVLAESVEILSPSALESAVLVAESAPAVEPVVPIVEPVVAPVLRVEPQPIAQDAQKGAPWVADLGTRAQKSAGNWAPTRYLKRGFALVAGIVASDVRYVYNTYLKHWGRRGAERIPSQENITTLLNENKRLLTPQGWRAWFKATYPEYQQTTKQQWSEFKAELGQIRQRLIEIKHPTQEQQSVTALSPFTGEISTILTASIIINLLALAFPLLMLQMYDRILPRQSLETLTLFAVWVGIAFALEALIRIVRSHITAWIAARFEQKAMLALAERALAEPLHQFERQGTGSVLEEFKTVSTLKHHYSGQTFQQLMDLPFTLLYVLIIFFVSIPVGLLLAAGYSIFVYLTWKNGREDPELIKTQKEGDLRRGNFLNEILRNVHTLKSMAMEALMLRRYERLQENSAKLMSKMTYALDMAAGFGNVFSPLMNVLVVALGAFLVINHHMTNGELAACILLGLRSLSPLQRLGGMWAKYQQDEILRDKLAQALRRPGLKPVAADNATAVSEGMLGTQVGSLMLSNVSYRFPRMDRDVFEHIDLDVKPGECIAIDGESGSGRSTLLQIMGGVLEPTAGRIMVDGVDLSDLDQAALSKHIAYLPQNTAMLEGSLLDNISVFSPERVEAALETARSLGLSDFVSRMPRGWDTPVGDQASDALPPGYRQRISIVRALSNRPNILLFDDATSAIDAEGDAVLLKFMEAVKGKITIVMVSQRPSFLRLASRRVKLNNGRLEALASNSVPQPVTAIVPLPTATSSVMQSGGAPYQSMSLDQYFDSPYKKGKVELDPWRHMHDTVASSFRENSDLSGCLTLMLRLLNARGSARQVAESLPYFQDRLDLTGLLNAVSQLGLKVKETHCQLKDLDSRSMPCLFVPDHGPSMVLMGRVANQVRIGFDVLSEPQMVSDLEQTGRALFFETVDAKVPDNRSWVRSILRRFSPLIMQGALSALVSGVVAITGSLFMMVVYSTVIPTGSGTTLFYLAVGTIIAVASGYYFTKHRSEILAYISGRIEYLFGTVILQQVLHMPASYTERASVGSQMTRLHSFESIRALFNGSIASTILEMPATLVLLVGLSIINPIALLVFVVMALVYAALYALFSGTSRQRVAESSKASAKRLEFLTEMVSKMRVVRECGAQYIWLNRFRDISADASMASFNAEKLSSMLVGVSYFVMMFAALLIVSVTAPFVMDQHFGPGVLIASMILMWRVLSPAQVLFTNMTRIELVQSSIRQIDALMKIPVERAEMANTPAQRRLEGSIDFARVSFRYGMNVDPALVGVEFKIKPGEMVAISGPNGGGKSTLLKLILGIYQPQAGSILIDNIDIRQMDPLELRRLIGYVPQDVQLFRATIAQNLRFSRPDATDDEVYQALDMAGALEQVIALPQGLESRVGDNTNELSNSLKQKILLARAYLTRAPIMLFDEPAGGLDAEADYRFMEVLKSLKGKSTVLFISHRPSHIRLADTLLVFDKGYLRAAGAPADLMRAPTAA
ncbi:MAG: ATP-binding cassette domain-containing protein [Fluviibacter sp.]